MEAVRRVLVWLGLVLAVSALASGARANEVPIDASPEVGESESPPNGEDGAADGAAEVSAGGEVTAREEAPGGAVSDSSPADEPEAASAVT